MVIWTSSPRTLYFIICYLIFFFKTLLESMEQEIKLGLSLKSKLPEFEWAKHSIRYLKD